jgi:hypothetical protein
MDRMEPLIIGLPMLLNNYRVYGWGFRLIYFVNTHAVPTRAT